LAEAYSEFHPLRDQPSGVRDNGKTRINHHLAHLRRWALLDLTKIGGTGKRPAGDFRL
jgi:hypothetical protein